MDFDSECCDIIAGQETIATVLGHERNDRDDMATMGKADLANADFIVRCVNCHEELLAALRGMVKLFDHYDPTEGQAAAFDKATDAIARAEGQT